jgi:glyoxylase-like metal-dependent hydrolase (beta-lactamase superfamily II)
MNLFKRWFSTLRTWLGLGDPSDDRLTPGHGWLLPLPDTLAKARQEGRPAPAEPRLP